MNQIFNSNDIQNIHNMPLFDTKSNDDRIWNLTSNDIYFVRSTYFLFGKSLFHDSSEATPGNWKQLWALKIPPKIKHLLWGILRNCLPTRVRLRDKGVQCPLTCSHCNNNLENSWHIFFECADAILV